MLTASFPNLRSVLCLGAHADDIEIGCGGALLRLLAEVPNLQVHWIVFSASGARREEALASADGFLARAQTKNVVIRDFRDSFFPHQGEQIKEYFCELAREISPDLIFTHRRNDAHQDHRTLAELTWCAFRDHVILEYEIPKYEGDLGQPNVFFRLDKATCQNKIELILDTYLTQRDKNWFSEDTYWALLRLRGVECQSPTKYAEAFFARKLTVLD